jgi:NitT/TauT family transport system substrate-binding protein
MFKTIRNAFSRYAGAGLALAVTLALAGTAQAAPAEVKLGTVAWIGYTPFYIAAEKDMFAKYGVKVTLQDFADPALIPAALQSGGLQGAMYTYDQVVTLVATGHDFKVVMPIDYSNGGDAVVASTAITDMGQLKGKKVAYPFSTCDNLLVVYGLEKAGLTEADIDGLDTTPENVAAALASGVPAGSTYEPNITKILKMGDGKQYHVILDSSAAPGLITDILYFSGDYIKANPTAVDGVIHGYLDALAFMKTNPDEAYAIAAKYLASSVDEVKVQAKGVMNIEPGDMAKYFEKRDDSQSLYKVGDLISKILIKRGQIPQAADVSKSYDPQFVAKLKMSAN